jgi:hypothetical protein
MASAARDIQATSPRDALTGVAARSVPVTRPQPLPLPTPPNSISPGLPAHGLGAQLQKARMEAKLEPIDSDLDLHDNGTAAGHRDAAGSPPDDSTGAITPVMLAKYHLPEILLSHGPLAIRHVMGCLATSVPGFAGIPPAKARRLVVKALEGRGHGSEGGGLDGDVEFEKVGWGRWAARRQGLAARERSARLSPTAGSYANGIPIARSAGWCIGRSRLQTSASSEGGSAVFSHDDRDITMLENEAEKMSMGGSGSASCSPAPDDDVAMGDGPDDATDDEDWAAVGAAGLRAASYSNSASGPQRHFSSGVYNSGGFRSVSYSAGMAKAPQATGGMKFPAFEEREAVEALLQLGSV